MVLLVMRAVHAARRDMEHARARVLPSEMEIYREAERVAEEARELAGEVPF